MSRIIRRPGALLKFFSHHRIFSFSFPPPLFYALVFVFRSSCSIFNNFLFARISLLTFSSAERESFTFSGKILPFSREKGWSVFLTASFWLKSVFSLRQNNENIFLSHAGVNFHQSRVNSLRFRFTYYLQTTNLAKVNNKASKRSLNRINKNL